MNIHRWEPSEIDQYPYLECGAYGHGWTDTPAPEGRTAMFGELVAVRCHRCEGWRFDSVRVETWELLARSYDMPEDYSFVTNGRPRRIEFLVALMRRRQAEAKKRRRARVR